MADNTILNAGAGGDTVRSLSDGTIKWPVGVMTFATTVSAGANVLQVVTPSAGLPVAQQGSWAVTASAGTNLNTSTLALESGGHLATLDGKTPALGQALAAGSSPVVLPAAQIATLTPLTTVATTQSGNWSVRAQDGAGTGLTSLAVGAQHAITVAIVDASGNQVTAFGGSGGTASNFGSAFPAPGTAIGAKDSTGTNMVPLNLTAAGALKVDASAATQPISGTVTANAGSGTFAVSAATLPLAAGAATSARQPAIGTAGTAAADVATIQGIASMTPVAVSQATAANLNATVVGTGTFLVQAAQSGTWNVGTVTTLTGITNPVTTVGNAASGASDSGNPVKVGGVHHTSAPTLADGQRGDIQLDANGLLMVAIASGGGSGGTASSFGSAFPATGTAAGFKDSTGTNMAAGNLTAGGALKVDASATTQPVSGTLTANIGTTGGLIVAQGSTTAGESGPLVQGAVTTSAPAYTTGQTAAISLDTAGSQRVVLTNTSVAMAQSGAWTISQADPTATSGTLSAADSVVSAGTGQNGQQLLSGTPTAGSSLTAPLSGDSTVSVQITGSFTGTIVFERSVDGGTAYVPANVYLDNAGPSPLASVTASCVVRAHAGGSTHFRVRATALASGTPAVKIQPGVGMGPVVGQVAASAETGTVFSGGVALTPKFAKIVASASGATTIVAAVTGKKIRVLRYKLSASGTVNVKWQSHVGPTDLTGLAYLVANASDGASTCEFGIFETIAGEALDVNLSAAVAVGGVLTYVEV